MNSKSRVPYVSLTAVVALGIATFFTLYSLIPVINADNPGLSSLFSGTMMAFVMGVQVFTPALIRRFSLRLVLAGTATLLGVGALIATVSDGLILLVIGGAVSGAAFGVLVVAGTQGVALLVPTNRLARALGTFGLATMASSALLSPAGVQFALTFSPLVVGIGACLLGCVAAGVSFGIPASAGRSTDATTVTGPSEPTDRGNILGGQKRPAVAIPWLVPLFLFFGIVLYSHGLSSLPVLASMTGSAAVIIFSVQAGNALGRWTGGELEARIGTIRTVIAGAVVVGAGAILGVLVADFALMILSAALVGFGAGIIQTVTLHAAMQRMGSGHASVMWNLAVDGGLWVGGILWGLALAAGFVPGAVSLTVAAVLIVGALLVLQIRNPQRNT